MKDDFAQMRFICECVSPICVQIFQYVIGGFCGLWPTGSNKAANHAREFLAAVCAGYVLVCDGQE